MHGGDRRQRALAGLVVALACLGLAGSAQGYIYYGDNQYIVRANNDGTNVDPHFIPITSSDVCGIAIDAGHIYWATNPAGVIGRANLDGTGINQTLITATAGSTCGIAVDSAHVYWASAQSSTTGSIGRSNLDGTSPQPDFVPLGFSPCGVAVDANTVYFGGDMFSPGPPQESPLAAPGPMPIPGANAPSACAIAVDGQYVYYGARHFPGPIARIPKLGGGETPNFITSRDVSSITTHGGYIYWTNSNVSGHGAGVGRALVDGSSPNQDFITQSASGEPTGIAVDDLAPPTPPPGDGGSPTFTLGKATLDKKKGTAKLAVTTTGAGSLELSGKTVKTASATLSAAGETELAIKAKGKTKKTLARKGKAKVAYAVAFTPSSGTPSSADGSLKLKRKRK